MRHVLRVLALESIIALVLFTAAGRVDLPWFWAMLALHATIVLSGQLGISNDLLNERLRPGPGDQDRRFRLLLIPIVILHLIVAGLDAGRFGWSGDLPVAVHVAGLAGMAAALGLATWSMLSNRFFSSAVRLQTDRGHHVVSAGPYRVVRHPGYAGMVAGALFGGLALGSLYSLIPLLPFILLVAVRAVREERFLHRSLEGYAAYMNRVRYRMLPGIW